MRSSVVVVSLAALLVVDAVASPAHACEEAAPTIEMKLAKQIEARQPVGTGESFAPGKLYCWNRVTGGDGEFTLYHVWLKDGKRVWKQPLTIKGARFATWSYLNVKPGSWKVEVQDESGAVLEQATFVVK
jgi:hypothetical protein